MERTGRRPAWWPERGFPSGHSEKISGFFEIPRALFPRLSLMSSGNVDQTVCGWGAFPTGGARVYPQAVIGDYGHERESDSSNRQGF